MNEKYIERPKKFDKTKYNHEYTKKNYTPFSTVLKPDLAERVNDYCKNNKMSKAEFIALAIELMDK